VTAPAPSFAQRMIRRNLMLGVAMVLLLGVGAGGWAATTSLSGAIIAGGTLVVDSYVKKVQHPTGGIVADILVRNGSTVNAGDVLIRLDETQTRANLEIVGKRLNELRARETRLAAERDGRPEIPFAETFAGHMDDPEIAKVVQGETVLFKARQTSRAGQTAQLEERSAQLQQEIEGLQAQISGKDREIELIGQEIDGVQQLWSKGLTQRTTINSLQREAARLTSERGTLISSIAQTRGKIAEIRLQILQVGEDLQQEVAKEMREIEGSIGEFEERRVAAEDQLRRVEIRAPQTGVVHELSVHTKDAVVSAGETVMLIVPAADKLEAEIKIAPQDIDQIELGQTVNLRFSAFNQRTTPEVTGTLDRVGADLTREQQTGLSYYVARVGVSTDELKRLGNLKLLPGMPVEAFLKTQDRTALSYLVKPIEDQVERAFRG
jgi:HlyD family secretion protein